MTGMLWNRFVAAALLRCSLYAQKRVITHEDVWLMKRVGEPAVSPDGKWHSPLGRSRTTTRPSRSTDLWLVPADGSAAPRRMTATKGAESGVVWSPDGTRLAFTARREGDDAAQIYVLALSGGEAQRVTSAPAGRVAIRSGGRTGRRCSTRDATGRPQDRG